jgi:hypothetical protein
MTPGIRETHTHGEFSTPYPPHSQGKGRRGREKEKRTKKPRSEFLLSGVEGREKGFN